MRVADAPGKHLEGRENRRDASHVSVSSVPPARGRAVGIPQGRVMRYGDYQSDESRWQTRDDSGWITIPGTERNDNRLCVYIPTEPSLYRLVVELIRTLVATGSQTAGRLSSNVLNH